MLTKLAFKNVGKSMRDYAIYFFTLVLGVSVFYMFNSIYAQQEIMVKTDILNQSMIALRQMLSIISLFVAVILGFLIIYANNFFIKRRKKELGLYMTLGMNKSKISTILVLETSFMAIVALIVGLVIGVFGSQFMSVFTAKIFEADMTGYKFVFSLEATIKSIIFFSIIFVVVIIFNTIAINKYKLIDLIYGGRKNETLKIKNIGVSILLFILSVMCLAISYVLILKNGMININILFWSSIALGSIGTILFFYSLSGMLTKLIQSNKKLYYRNLNIFVTRQLSSKINTNFVSISVVCIVLLLVIGIFSSGYSMQHIMSSDLRKSVPYDFSFYNIIKEENDVNIYDKLPDYMKNKIIKYHEYKIYNSENLLYYKDFSLNYSDVNFDMSNYPLDFIMLSDYNEILKLLGKDPINLSENEYIINTSVEMYKKIAQQFVDKGLSLHLGDKVLSPKGNVQNTPLSNGDYNIIFIINDIYGPLLYNTENTTLNILCESDEVAEEFLLELNDYVKEIDYVYWGFTYFDSKQDIYASSITTKAVISFLAIYLGIVFMITCAAILAIQQLAEATDNKDRYALLRKLGTEKKMLNRALFVQILSYFLLPLILAVVHSVVGLTAANDAIKIFGKINVAGTSFITAIFVVIVYGAYFGLTYMGGKSIINK